MNSRDAIQTELQDLQSNLPLNNNEQPVFTVPEGYFENFAASVWARLENQQLNAADELKQLSPMLAAISNHTPYSVPENYFSDLATDLPAFANDEALPEFLESHTKQMPYTIPSGYFDGLAAQVAAKLPKEKAKVVSMASRFSRYAAAAAVIGVMVVAGLFYFKGPNSASIDPTKQPEAWVAQHLKNIPNRDLEAFLKTTDTGYSNKELARSNTDVRRMLTDVSTTELDAFLSELPIENDFSRTN